MTPLCIYWNGEVTKQTCNILQAIFDGTLWWTNIAMENHHF